MSSAFASCIDTASRSQLETPGAHDVIVFEKGTRQAGKTSGISHFGFRLVDPKDVDAAAKQAEAAGGRVLRRGEFLPESRMYSSPIPTDTRSKSGTSEASRPTRLAQS